MSSDSKKQFIFIIRLACLALFLGRAWQHLFWDAPFRTLFWSQDIMQPIIESLTDITWGEWVSANGVGEVFINYVIKGFGILYTILFGVTIFLKSHHKKMGKLLIVGSLSVFFLSFLLFMEKNYALGMLIEHSIQFGIPMVMYISLYKPETFEKSLPYFKLFISLTFIGHGLYAIGFYPVPGKFIDMIINVFGFSEENAVLMLRFAGILDFSAAIFIFVPYLEIYALGFNIFWGITTALARTVAHFDFDLASMSLNQWLMETIFRLPHGLLPLALFLYFRHRSLNPVNHHESCRA